MESSKRHSASGRGMASKAGALGGVELDSALSRAVGSRIRVTTSLPGHTIEGSLFAACPITNLVAINTATPPPNPTTNPATLPGDYHVIHVAQIQNFQILAPAKGAPSTDGVGATGFKDVVPPLTRVDIDALKAKEEAAVKKMKEYDATRGKGVSKEAQEIFDWFNRSLPTRWNAAQIVVNDCVLVSPPYTVDDCKAPKDQQAAETHIKKVLEGYYARKKAQQGTSRPVPAMPFVPRKGG